jgi:hypothetical protein
MAIFRADGGGALESADALDAVGLKLYPMIASQLRWLYYTLRGEFDKAVPHRKLVEEHAAEVGSVWQVETWQGASLQVVYPQVGDIIGCQRVADQLEIASRTSASLKPYARVARASLLLVRGELVSPALVERAFVDHNLHAPREQAGWARLKASLAKGHNLLGDHEQAKRICEEALEHVSDPDRDYAAHFMPLEIELALADAALGQSDAALARIDGLLARFQRCDHPLVLGALNEARARIAHLAGNQEAFERSLAETERWFVATEAPFLVSQCKRLRELRDGRQSTPPDAPLLGEKSETTIIGGVSDTNPDVTVTDGISAPRHSAPPEG